MRNGISRMKVVKPLSGTFIYATGIHYLVFLDREPLHKSLIQLVIVVF